MESTIEMYRAFIKLSSGFVSTFNELLAKYIHSDSRLQRPLETIQRPFFASSSSVLGTLTKWGTVTALILRNACGTFVSHHKALLEWKRTEIWSEYRGWLVDSQAHLPPPSVPSETPRIPNPALPIVKPPPRTEELFDTYILNWAIW